MNRVKPKKFLGQHFLTDLDVAKRIADTLLPYKDYPVLEVGPGMGVLTQYLLQNHDKLTVVELDRDSVPYLQEHFPVLHGRIIEGDFLELKLEQYVQEKFCVIGNYPYNISSQILFKVLDYKDSVVCCSGMFQKEVAERVAATPGGKAYGIISVLLQAWYDIEYLFTVDETVFNPPPKVKSGVIRLIRNNRTSLSCDEKLFKTVVKTAFQQRRKMMRVSLRSILGKDCELYQQEIFTERPERLSVKQFEELTNTIQVYLAQKGK